MKASSADASSTWRESASTPGSLRNASASCRGARTATRAGIEAFAHEEVVVAGGIVRQPSHHLEAVPRVEVRRLEAVGVQRELHAAAVTRDLLGGTYQP